MDAFLYRKERYKHLDQKIVNMMEKHRIKKLIKGLPSIQSILDVPSGYGRFAKILKEFSESLIGGDLSLEMLSEAERKEYVALVQTSIFSLPFRDNAFDLVFTVRLFHHFSFDEISEAIDELSRVSRRFLLFSVYIKNHLHILSRKVRRNLARDIRFFSQKQIEELLERKGWKIVKVVSVIPVIYSQRLFLARKDF